LLSSIATHIWKRDAYEVSSLRIGSVTS